MATYRKRLTVEAEQFWPDKKPWPEGVVCDPSSGELESDEPGVYWLDTGYDDNSSRVVDLRAGDWVITNGEEYSVDFRELCTAADFPNRYEPEKEPSDGG